MTKLSNSTIGLLAAGAVFAAEPAQVDSYPICHLCKRRAQKFLMRAFLLALVVIGAASAASSSRAQTYDPSYPVCLHANDWGGYYECRYTSLSQCAASASGRRAYCVTNPYFARTHRGFGPAQRAR